MVPIHHHKRLAFLFSNDLKSQSDYLIKKLSTVNVDKLQKVLLSIEFL